MRERGEREGGRERERRKAKREERVITTTEATTQQCHNMGGARTVPLEALLFSVSELLEAPGGEREGRKRGERVV